jgi:hypothetical protein
MRNPREAAATPDNMAEALLPKPCAEGHMVTITTGRELVGELENHFRLVETGTDWPEFAEQRSEARYELESGKVPVEVSSRYGLTAQGLLADISLSGARIITDYVPCRGEVVRLAFDVRGKRLVLDGEVRHNGVDGSIRFFGVRFVE